MMIMLRIEIVVIFVIMNIYDASNDECDGDNKHDNMYECNGDN